MGEKVGVSVRLKPPAHDGSDDLGGRGSGIGVDHDVQTGAREAHVPAW
jgi:hypothetical protein